MDHLKLVLGFLLTADLVIWGCGARTLAQMPPSRKRRILGGLFHGFCLIQSGTCLGIIASYHWGVTIDYLLPTPLAVVVILWHLLVIPLALAGSLLGLIGEIFWASFRFFWRKPALAMESAYPGDKISRRQFLGAATALAPPLLTLALSAASAQQLGRFRIRRLTVPVAGLPPALDGLTIAHLSDTHIGIFTRGDVLRQIAEATNALQPELVLFTGDLIHNSETYIPQAIEMLKSIRGPMALCPGNHDELRCRAVPFSSRLKAANLPLLVDETLSLTLRGVPVQILGLSWDGPPNWGQKHHHEYDLATAVEELIQQRDPAAFPILIAHHPHAWDYCGEIPLTFSGHTHGGQLMLNERIGFGPAIFRYWSGLYTRPIAGVKGASTGEQRTQSLIVSNGIGNWFPLRTATPAEILHVTLRRA